MSEGGSGGDGLLASVRDAVRAIDPYQPGKPIAEVQRELGLSDVIKVASNENPLGPSPRALDALRDALVGVNRYPESSAHDLRGALARKLAVSPDTIVLGNGANEVIELVAHTLLDPRDEVVMSAASFAMYPVAAQLMGAKAVTVPCRAEWRHDLDAMRRAVGGRTKLVFVCNPNNPTGTSVGARDLRAFLESVPRNVAVLVDEAYYDFVDDPEYPQTIPWLAAFRNLIVLRSLSKVYGLAGLRVGYGVMDAPFAAMVERTREPFNVNLLAQIAGTAAVADDDHVKKTVENNRTGRAYLFGELTRLGARPVPSQANFVFVELSRPAPEVFQSMLRKGVIVRPMPGVAPNAIRISVGTPDENRRTIAALEQALSAPPAAPR